MQAAIDPPAPVQNFIRLTARSRNSAETGTPERRDGVLDIDEGEFRQWLKNDGLREGMIDDYLNAIQRYYSFLGTTSLSVRRAFTFFKATMGMRRLTGFALRRLQSFFFEVLETEVDFGVPARLPCPSRPNPSPLSRGEILLLLRTARRMYPRHGRSARIGRTVRGWLILTLEWGARIGETPIEWTQIDFDSNSATLCGKTGEGWVPLFSRSLRVLKYLRLHAGEAGGPFVGK